MDIYLPIAEMTVRGEVILLLGTFVGLLSGLFGVGGGFLTTPFLIFVGVPPAIAVGTQANQLVASSMSGFLGHFKKGNVDVKMAGVMLVGSFFGTIAGVLIFRLLQYVGQIDLAIPVLYVLILGSMGSMMLYESASFILKKKASKHSDKPELYKHPVFQSLPYKMRFPRSRIYVSALIPGAMGFFGGILVSVLGIGGGFIMVPAMIYILGMPTMLVAGTSLFQIMLSSIFTTILQAVTNNTVDIVLAFLLIVGGVIGAQVGVKAARYIKGAYARIILASILLIIAFRLTGELLIPPAELYSVVLQGVQ